MRTLTINEIDTLQIVSTEFKTKFKSFISKGFNLVIDSNKYKNREFVIVKDNKGNIKEGFVLFKLN